MNLPLWRAEDVAGRREALLRDRDVWAEDQSALNIAAKGRIIPLPARFNLYADPAAHADPDGLPLQIHGRQG